MPNGSITGDVIVYVSSDTDMQWDIQGYTNSITNFRWDINSEHFFTRIYQKDFMSMLNSEDQRGALEGFYVSVTTPPTMDVTIDDGRALSNNVYIEAPATTQTINVADPANPRRDIIFVTPAGSIEYSTGTPAAIPHPPYLPPRGILLATIQIPAGTAAIGINDVHDERRIVYGNKYKDIYEGGNPDAGVCVLHDDNAQPLDDTQWDEQYDPMKQWGG